MSEEENLTFKLAASQILKQASEPLNYNEITKRALDQNLIKSAGKTPERTMIVELNRDLSSKLEKSIFKKTKEGIYELNYKNFQFKVLEDENEIHNAQKTFLKTLQVANTKRGKITISFPGPTENVTDDVSWLPDSGIWWYSRLYEDATIPRYWNCFGLDEPKWNKNNNITIELNTPIHGGSRQIRGAYVKDSDGEIYLTHSGILGGGSPGGFYDAYPNLERWIFADDVSHTIFLYFCNCHFLCHHLCDVNLILCRVQFFYI